MPSLARFGMIGVFYGAIGHQGLKLISVKDIGVFAGKALAQPDHPLFKNATLDLAAGNYDLRAVRKAFQNAQGSSPWFASWLPRMIRGILPYDFKEMTICKTSGYFSFRMIQVCRGGSCCRPRPQRISRSRRTETPYHPSWLAIVRRLDPSKQLQINSSVGSTLAYDCTGLRSSKHWDMSAADCVYQIPSCTANICSIFAYEISMGN